MGLFGFLRSIYSRIMTMKEMILWLWRSKNWWLIPFIIILFLFGLLFAVGTSTPLGPLIYALF